MGKNLKMCPFSCKFARSKIKEVLELFQLFWLCVRSSRQAKGIMTIVMAKSCFWCFIGVKISYFKNLRLFLSRLLLMQSCAFSNHDSTFLLLILFFHTTAAAAFVYRHLHKAAAVGGPLQKKWEIIQWWSHWGKYRFSLKGELQEHTEEL